MLQSAVLTKHQEAACIRQHLTRNWAQNECRIMDNVVHFIQAYCYRFPTKVTCFTCFLVLSIESVELVEPIQLGDVPVILLFDIRKVFKLRVQESLTVDSSEDLVAEMNG